MVDKFYFNLKSFNSWTLDINGTELFESSKDFLEIDLHQAKRIRCFNDFTSIWNLKE
jgi:hypothetical protein